MREKANSLGGDVRNELLEFLPGGNRTSNAPTCNGIQVHSPKKKNSAGKWDDDSDLGDVSFE